MKFSGIDWPNWAPRETATLMFVRMDGMVLLIRKLKGMGAGLINAPGGRVDPGETPEQAAVREAQEELHVTPIGVRKAGELAFQFTDGDQGCMSREEMLFHVITHGAYHRGNVGQMLKGIDVAPPRDLLTKFLHLREPQRRQPPI